MPRPPATIRSLLGIATSPYAGLHKRAAEMVRRTEMVEKHHDHCPHCDHEFTEKGYPRPKLPDDEKERDRVFMSGDYDEHCPACGGIVDSPEMTDDELDKLDVWGGDEMKEMMRQRRETRRRRRAEREKSASDRYQKLRARRGECLKCGTVIGEQADPGGSVCAACSQQRKAAATGGVRDTLLKLLPSGRRMLHSREAAAVGAAGTAEAARRKLEKSAVLGFKALTGHLGSIKKIIRAARADGMQGLGTTRFDAALGRNVRTPITRVKPAAPLAQAPHTQHLPTGVSQTSRRSYEVGSHDVQIQKGLPRQTIELSPAGVVSYAAGVKGGTNPSPIASMLHEVGHGYAHDSVGRLARATGGFGGRSTRDMRLLGTHELPGGYHDLDKVVNELAANNAALQLLRHAGAKPRALSYFQAARQPSFDSYLHAAWNPSYAISDAQRQLLGRVTALGRRGHTPGFSGLDSLYKSSSIASLIRRARNATDVDPTPAQAAAGNYSKGEFSFKGLTIKIENPRGTERCGYDKDGKVTWRSAMHADYGYFKGTKAADGDAVDCFIGPDTGSDLVVAIDQYRGNTFDETKFVLGVTTREQGEKLYLRHYPRGWTLGPVSTTTVPQLKKWLKEGATKRPFKGQRVKTAAGRTVAGAMR